MNLFAEFSSNPGNDPPLNDLVIRPARETDVPALAQITAEREGGSATAFVDSQKVFVRRSLETDRVLLLVAEIASEVIGFGKVTHFSPAVGSPPDVAPEGWYLSGGS